MNHTNQNIQELLNDLYNLDPELRGHEKEILVLIEKLTALKPESTFNEQFKQRLRAELRQRISDAPATGLTTNFMNFFTRKNMMSASVGVIITALIVIPATALITQTPSQTFDFGLSIKPAGAQAFGPLTDQSQVAQSGTEAMVKNTDMMQTRPQSGGGGVVALSPGLGSSPAALSSINPSIAPVPDAKIIAPDYFVNYKYTYRGDALTQPDAQLDVLKRSKPDMATAAQFASLLKKMNFKVVDLGTFGSARAQSMTFVEDKPFGYTININFDESSISVFENWMQWQPAQPCNDQACIDAQRIRPEQVPSNEQLFAITNQFVKDHKVNLSSFSAPEVAESFPIMYLKSAEAGASDVYIPEIVNVIYPLKINNRFVYEEGGQKYGLMITVNIRHNRVSGMSNLNALTYESSAYAAETDVEKIKSIAEKGGLYNYQYEGATRTVDLDLGTPEYGYVRSWQYTPTSNTELLVPAYIFPITNVPADQPYFRKSITVPLIKEIINKAEQENPGRPMPLDLPAASPVAEPAVIQEPTTLR